MKRKTITILIGCLIILSTAIYIGINNDEASLTYGYIPGALVDAPSIKLIHENEIKNVPFKTGRDSMEALIADQVDVSTTALWPYLLALQRDPSLKIIATITQANSLGIVTHSSAQIQTVSDLRGKKIGYTQATSSQILLEKVLEKHNVSLTEVTLIHLSPADMVNLMQTGEIDAAVTWEPNLNMMLTQLDSQSELLEGSTTLHNVTFVLVTKEEYIKSQPTKLKEIMAKLSLATLNLQENPAENQKLISTITHLEENQVKTIWSKFDFTLHLDDTIVSEMKELEEWGIEKKFIAKSQNLSEAIYGEFIN